MSDIELKSGDLRDLIGTRVRYHGGIFEIIEILDDGPSLVIQDCDHTSIQPDQHGEAHRRVPQTLTLPIHTSDAGHMDPIAMGLDLIDDPLALRQ